MTVAHDAAHLVRRTRLVTGLVLFTFVTTHLLNHALGLISLDAMEAGRAWFVLLWRNPVGSVALYGSLLTHFLLALWSLYRRRTFRMPAWEAVQVVLGLCIPPLLTGHVVGTRVASSWFDAPDPYARVVLGLWALRPEYGLRQSLVVVIAWSHGCVGLHYWLRLRRGYARIAPVLLGVAVLVPALALLGFAHAGREIAARAAAAGSPAAAVPELRALTPPAQAALGTITSWILWALLACAVALVLARGARAVRARTGLSVTYPGGRRAPAPPGATVLEVSRSAGIPHVSVCGGRGRCSTCRIRIVRGLDALPPPAPEERRVLDRIGAPPTVRLACQLRPTCDVTVEPLLPAVAEPRGAFAPPGHRTGHEREVAVLFADLRGFTALAERRLPYDVVFFLNRYFAAVGAAIARTGGVVNQFTGDGVMALFGVDAPIDDACRSALDAAGEVVRSLESLSRELSDDLPAPLRIGIGIHAGPAVVGQMGFGEARYLTAVGDTVHVASRLQDLTKHYGCQLIVSEPVAARAGLDVSRLDRHELTVRNRAEPVAIYVVADASVVIGPGRP